MMLNKMIQTYSKDVPHERDAIDAVHEVILQYPSGVTLWELQVRHDLRASVLATNWLLENGLISLNITWGLDDISKGKKFFPIQ